MLVGRTLAVPYQKPPITRPRFRNGSRPDAGDVPHRRVAEHARVLAAELGGAFIADLVGRAGGVIDGCVYGDNIQK